MALCVALTASASEAQSLRGSQASLDRQNRVAREHDYSFIRDSRQLRRFVNAGYLVPVDGDRNYRLNGVSFPYARPEVELFIRRLAEQYRDACGERLVVTSLTRPQNAQPRNASRRSVHPTGMALDLRLSRSRSCRTWLEGVLTRLEASGVLEATRERYPAHYHVALFPRPYFDYVERISDETPRLVQRVAANVSEALVEYTVRRGDSLWTIARRHGTTVDRLRSENRIRGNRIMAGQTLKVPTQQQ
ncbi:MAG: DUF5715 family protein [Gemmatimonadota bacterium]